jgi:hypothetical protein
MHPGRCGQGRFNEAIGLVLGGEGEQQSTVNDVCNFRLLARSCGFGVGEASRR